MRTSARFLAFCLSILSGVTGVLADSATWDSSPANNRWKQSTNWSSGAFPDGPNDVATFGSSDLTQIIISGAIEVASIVFDPEAPPYEIQKQAQYQPTNLVISGSGVINNSGLTQTFELPTNSEPGSGMLSFTGSADAGTDISYIVSGAFSVQQTGSGLFFEDAATAGSASFINEGGMFGSGGTTFLEGTTSAKNASFTNEGALQSWGTGGSTLMEGNSTGSEATFIANGSQAVGGDPGLVLFIDSSDGGNASLTANSGGVAGALGGLISFGFSSNAGDATATANGETLAGFGPGSVLVSYVASAGNATLIAKGATAEGAAGGSIVLANDSLGGTARVELLGNGTLDISGHTSPGVTVGSIEGTGTVFLGGMNLGIGSNNLSTVFSGSVVDGGANGGTGGSVTKVGTGSFTFSSDNSYTGGTTVSAGVLLANNSSGSATGTGNVAVNDGTLGGGGLIAGEVTVGTGSGSGAILQPAIGITKKVTMTVQGLLTFNADATYSYRLKTPKAEIVANGVIVNGDAQFTMTAPTKKLRSGLTATAISNTSATPINGTFANLPDGGTITVGTNTFKANYEGGDGNDLTLTVQ